jgi:hypothetical protein
MLYSTIGTTSYRLLRTMYTPRHNHDLSLSLWSVLIDGRLYYVGVNAQQQLFIVEATPLSIPSFLSLILSGVVIYFLSQVVKQRTLLFIGGGYVGCN